MRHGRKTPIHLPLLEFGNRLPIVFVTVATARRRPLLARPEIHALLLAGWHAADRWRVGRYVIMPDHVHFFCAPNGLESPALVEWVAYWKAHVSRRWPDRSEPPVWQPDFWDRQLRAADRYDEKWHYVRQNPVRHGLVERVEDWPYQGELHMLEWHDL